MTSFLVTVNVLRRIVCEVNSPDRERMAKENESHHVQVEDEFHEEEIK